MQTNGVSGRINEVRMAWLVASGGKADAGRGLSILDHILDGKIDMTLGELVLLKRLNADFPNARLATLLAQELSGGEYCPFAYTDQVSLILRYVNRR